MNLRKLRLSRLALAALSATAVAAHAEDAAPIYAGKTVTIVIGVPPGGGYDTYARLLSRHLGKHLPGDPNVIVQNMPGADSNTAATFVARTAPKDGTFIAGPNAPQPLFPILGNFKVNYDPSRLNYLGSATDDDYMCIVRPDAPATTFAQMLKTPVVMGGTSANGTTGTMPILLDNVLGAKFKVVLGYPGTRALTLAIRRGEIQGMCGMNWTSFESQFSDLLENNVVKIVAQENVKGLPQLDKMGIPLTISFAKTDRQRRILEIVYSQELFARPYFVAAEVPQDRLAILRRAFMEALRDPELLADAKRIHVTIAPMTGEEMQALIKKIYANPADIRLAARQAIRLKK